MPTRGQSCLLDGEQSGEWARKAAEASTLAQAKASKSPLAKRLGKKDAGLKVFGFCTNKASSAETASGAASSTNTAPGEKLLRRGQFPHRQYCYLIMDLQGGDNGTKTTVAVAEKMRSLLTQLATSLPGSALVPLNRMSNEAVWTKATQVPNQRFSEVRKMMAFTSDLDNLLKRVPRNKSKQFSGCLLYTSPSPRDRTRSRMPSSA